MDGPRPADRMARRALERRLIEARASAQALRCFRARVEKTPCPFMSTPVCRQRMARTLSKGAQNLSTAGRPVCLRSRKRLDNRLARNLLATCCALPQRRRSEAVVNLTEPLASAAPRPFETAASAPQYRRPGPKRAVAEDAGVKRK